jgi:hypothetical protein
MKYQVSFQYLPKGAERPIDHNSASDFESDNSAVIPVVGDFVHIIKLQSEHAPDYSGRVRTRLFRYFEADLCAVNIIVEQDDETNWGKLIKE